MMINGKELSEPEVKAYIKELEAFKSRAFELLSCAVDHMAAIAENVREECGEAACGLCQFDSPLTEYGEMLYECPGCESRTDCFRWKRADEVEELLGQPESK